MPNTRKKVIKTVYKNEDESEVEEAFSDSGSEAKISGISSSDDEIEEQNGSSEEEFVKHKKHNKNATAKPLKKKFVKCFLQKINKQISQGNNRDSTDEVIPAVFSVKDLTEEDKLLPSVLNLSESDSSDDELIQPTKQPFTTKTIYAQSPDSDNENDNKSEYNDVWSNNVTDESEEIARKTFHELEQQKSALEETKATLHNYKVKQQDDFDVKDLLAQGEVVLPELPSKNNKVKKVKDDSDSEMEDWEEVKESKLLPQQGLQLIVDLPNSVCRKTKKVDVEMMMKRKINRVKKEYQIYMHKVHVLCWLGHGNYVSKTLNDQELLAAALSLVPSKECYPGERVGIKYLEQITTWYKDKLTLKQDKNENKFKPKAPPLKDILISQIKNKVVTTRKYLVFIFVCMLRALGLQCRVMFNFVTLPLKPPNAELCSLSTKPKDENIANKENPKETKDINTTKYSSKKKRVAKKSQSKEVISQVDGADDNHGCNFNFVNIAQFDGNDDASTKQTRSSRVRKANDKNLNENDASPPKRSRQTPSPKTFKNNFKNECETSETLKKSKLIAKDKHIPKLSSKGVDLLNIDTSTDSKKSEFHSDTNNITPRKTRSNMAKGNKTSKTNLVLNLSDKACKLKTPRVIVTEVESNNSSKYFKDRKSSLECILPLSKTRKRSSTATLVDSQYENVKKGVDAKNSKTRTKSAPGPSSEKSKYFTKDEHTTPNQCKKYKLSSKQEPDSDQKRVSHRDLAKTRSNVNKNNVTDVLVSLIKGRIKEVNQESKKGIIKGNLKKDSDSDSDYLLEDPKSHKAADSDDDFKVTKISTKANTAKNVKTDRRVLSSNEDTSINKIDVWCEVFVEELEQWISVDVIKGTVHCAENIYTRATHPVCYIVGWDNNNNLKDLTRRYVPHWNTVTRKQRVEPLWWNKAVQVWLGPKNAKDREEDEQLDRMQLEAPLPKSIAEYKNHPLYALQRHLLKYEALYPPDAAVLGFVRKEPVYARECVYVCRSRDTWLKEAKVVKLGEKPYKVVKARPKWDKLSNKLITDKPLEIFGPWQVQDYEPPIAENGVVPRNAYGNVELFKDCMLPKGTVHIKLPGLNRIAKKLNIDCAPAMTGFDFNGGWSHPVYDGFVVCKEFEEIITEAWIKDQEEQERKEREKIEARVYSNWRRLIKGLFIRERLKDMYGFEEPSTSQDKKKSKGPRLVVKRK